MLAFSASKKSRLDFSSANPCCLFLRSAAAACSFFLASSSANCACIVSLVACLAVSCLLAFSLLSLFTSCSFAFTSCSCLFLTLFASSRFLPVSLTAACFCLFCSAVFSALTLACFTLSCSLAALAALESPFCCLSSLEDLPAPSEALAASAEAFLSVSAFSSVACLLFLTPFSQSVIAFLAPPIILNNIIPCKSALDNLSAATAVAN